MFTPNSWVSILENECQDATICKLKKRLVHDINISVVTGFESTKIVNCFKVVFQFLLLKTLVDRHLEVGVKRNSTVVSGLSRGRLKDPAPRQP